MERRDTNWRMVIVFVLCAVSIVAVTWTIGEKFIPEARIALVVNCLVAVGLAVLFERYLEGAIGRSIDSLQAKIRRVAQGDLTQRFTEDPDDILPYGLSYELNEMMKFFRGHVGDLWKVSAMLAKQLGQFVAATQEALEEFRSEVDFLREVGQNLEAVRKEVMRVVRDLSDLKVNADSDAAAIVQVGDLSREAPDELDKGKSLFRRISGYVTDIGKAMDAIGDFLDGFRDISRRMAAVEKSMAELRTEAHLVKLNASIDSINEAPEGANAVKLIEESRELAGRIVAISQESGSALATTDSAIAGLLSRLKGGRDNIDEGLDAINESLETMGIMGEKCAEAASGYSLITDHVEKLVSLLDVMDKQTGTFSDMVKASAARFDKLHADTQITLMKFDQLIGKTEAIKENLDSLEEFRKLFTIA